MASRFYTLLILKHCQKEFSFGNTIPILSFIKLCTCIRTCSRQNYPETIIIWVPPCENVSASICGQRRPRSACTFAQSDKDCWILKNVSMESKCLYATLQMCRKMWLCLYCACSKVFFHLVRPIWRRWLRAVIDTLDREKLSEKCPLVILSLSDTEQRFLNFQTKSCFILKLSHILWSRISNRCFLSIKSHLLL